MSFSPHNVIVIEQLVGLLISQRPQKDVGAIVGKEGINVMTPCATQQWSRDPVLGDALQTVSSIRTELLDAIHVPIFISITVFAIVIVVVYGTFTPPILL
jgi:hypothetical protein